MSLSYLTVRNAKSIEKAYKLFDRNGLYLLVSSHGNKSFRYKYRFAGREKVLVLGQLPATSLAQARARHADARKLTLDGKDPGVEARRAKLQRQRETRATFKLIADEWVLTTRHAGPALTRSSCAIVSNAMSTQPLAPSRWGH